MTTGAKIQALRKRKALTQEQLAQHLGVSRQAISRWELDEALPDTQNLMPLKEALGVSLDVLLDPHRDLENPDPAPQSPPPPPVPSNRKWLWAVPGALVLAYYLVVSILTGITADSGPVFSGGLLLICFYLCLWIYLAALGGYLLWLLIRFLREREKKH